MPGQKLARQIQRIRASQGNDARLPYRSRRFETIKRAMVIMLSHFSDFLAKDIEQCFSIIRTDK